MSDEKHHNPANPEYKLDELNGIPGEVPLDKNLAWEKLYPRLHRNSGRKVSGWYRMAAACILSVIFIFGLSRLNKDKSLVKNKPGSTQNQDPAVLQKPAQGTNPAEDIMPLVKSKKLFQKTAEEYKSRQKPVQASLHKNLLTRLNTDNDHKEIKTAIQKGESLSSRNAQRSYQSNDSALTERKNNPVPIQPIPDPALNTKSAMNVLSSVPKKKLRVIHVNELDEPAETTNNLVRNSGRHNFRLKWNESPASSNTIPENDYNHNELVKISLPFPN